MPSHTVLIIRHAEKPLPNGDNGVDENGAPNSESLTPRGWQRAGAWAELFVPALGHQSVLPKPDVLYASNPDHHDEATADDAGGKSRRPLETITPLADKLGFEINQSITKRKVTDLAAAVSAASGVALVCWQHEMIIEIVNAISSTLPNVPAKWPSDRFNVLFRLDRADDTTPWEFQQIVPVLLDGDSPAPIPIAT
jgi:hypothetical protein